MTQDIINSILASVGTALLSYIAASIFKVQKKVDLLEQNMNFFKEDFKGINTQLENIDKRMDAMNAEIFEHKFSIRRNTQLWKDHTVLLDKNRENIAELQKTLSLISQKCDYNHGKKKDS